MVSLKLDRVITRQTHELLSRVGYNTSMPGLATERGVSKILIVDDDEGVTQTFARMLRLEGYQVRTALNAETGPRRGRSAPIPTRSSSTCGCRSSMASAFSAACAGATINAPRPSPS